MTIPKTIGIIGGMGPKATSDLFRWIIGLTPSQNDNNHIHVLIDNNPQVPSRIDAIEGTGPSPLPELLRMSLQLIKSGSELLLIPCNTASVFIPKLQKLVNKPILGIINETVKYIVSYHPNIKKVGIMGTYQTIKMGLYQSQLIELGYQPVVLSKEKLLKFVVEATHGKHGVKAGYYDKPKKLLIKACELYRDIGAEVIIMGCTEIPVALRQEDVDIPLINPTKILAQSAVDFALSTT